MDFEIQFIPVIELPTKKDAESKKTPAGSVFTNSTEWQEYQDRELLKNYTQTFSPISPMIFQYPIMEITKDEDWLKIIELHIGDTDISNSCSFFGGYALKVGKSIELHPQCCGLFEEINDWKKILEDDFESFYLTECHPAPKFYAREKDLIIDCMEDHSGPFIPDTKKEIILDLSAVRTAINELLEDLKEFSFRLDRLSLHFGVKNISDILVWGNPLTT